MFSILSRETAMEIRHFGPFCAIAAISIVAHISVTATSNF